MGLRWDGSFHFPYEWGHLSHTPMEAFCPHRGVDSLNSTGEGVWGQNASIGVRGRKRPLNGE